MRRNMKKPCCTMVAIVVTLCPTGLRGGDTAGERLTLKGLTEIDVLAEMDPKQEVLGLTTDQVQSDVELRLRKAGIVVAKNVLSGYLYVNLNVLDSGVGTYAIAMEISFEQKVILPRQPASPLWAPTWGFCPIVVTTPKAEYRNLVRTKIADFVDRFSNAYLSANPK